LKAARLAIFHSAAGFACGVYLLASSFELGLGFPLDDAWIHQTYARNLGRLGEWSFVPGTPSAGSTSPLWSALLALGFAAGQNDPRAWTYLLGGLSLAGLAWAGQVLFERLAQTGGPDSPTAWRWLAGLFLAGEFHLVWAAVSGMETDLIGVLYLAGLAMLAVQRPRWFWTGALAGLASWVRPDGLTLLGPAFFVWLLRERRWGGLLGLLAGFGALFLPYLLFNMATQGSLWPNTFYAKQAEYAVLQTRPLLLRFLDELRLPLTGAGVLLLPGALYYGVYAFKRRKWAGIAAVLWFLGYAFLYAWRLPVTYQYGRYLMPAMPVYFVMGLAGMRLILTAGGLSERVRRLAGFAWRAGLLAVWLGFFVIGAGRYARDVAIIESEMVAAARWVSAHTVPGELIAAHDIGALGYFGGRDLVDMAGLVTPEVIPFMRDEEQLARYLDQQGVSVLVVFPTWYATLADDKPVLFTSQGAYSGENMTIYRWK